MPASPQPAPYVPSTGYKRSASVTAAVDFFEQRARSVSASSLGDKARSSPQASPRPSISAEAGPGPSSQTSPRLRGSGLPKASSARGRSTASPSVPLPGRSGRASLDSAASPDPKPPVGLGMRGIGAAEVNGTRRASETALLAASTGSSSPSTTSRLRQPQAGVRSSLSAESTSSPQKPSAIGMRRTGTSSSTEAGPTRTSTPPMPRSGSAARLANGPKTPSPRIGPSSSGIFGSPRRTPASPASRIPTRTATRTSASASSSASPSLNRAPATARQPLAPTVSISHATPEGSRIPKSASSVSVARSTPLNGSANASSASLSNGPGSRGSFLGLSPSARSQSYSSHLSSAHSSAFPSGRGTPSRTDVVLLDTEDEKELPPLPTHDTNRPRTGPPIAIPKRHSSAASPSSPTSPTLPSSSFSSHNGHPIISPRQSSKHAFDDEVPSPTADVPSHPVAPTEPARRASQTILLGEIPPSSRRFDPGLTIEPPPSLAGMQSLSASRPSPPIPAKSPLRSLSRASSIGRRSSGVHSRVVSRDSTFSSIYDDAEAGSESAATAKATSGGTSDSTTAVVGQVAHDARADSPPDMPTSADVELTPQTRYFDPSADVDAYHAKRLTTMTYASSYSQDSRPSSAVAVVNMGEFGMLSEGNRDGERRVRRQSRMDDLWGRSNRSISEKSPGSDTFSPSLPSPLTTILPNRQTDSPDSSALNTATTTSDISRHAITGHSPHVARLEVDEPPRPIRSPSAPMLNGMASDPAQPAAKAAKLLGIDSAVRPTRSNLPAPLLPSAMTRSPTAPVISPRTPSSLISKRTHLIREIANTERGFATDLALIRDAYLGQYLRPTSVSSGGESFSGSSRRGSNTTTTDNRRSSGTDWTLPTPPSVSPFPRSPSEGVYSGGQGYFTSTNLAATASATSLKQPSPGMKSAAGGGGAMMAPPVGKPLSPADARTVFLNLEQLAAGAEEMARGFEGAMGEEEVGPGFVAREGEAGSDRLGEVFMSLIPRLRPVYHYYCSRQESASSRLQELLSDSSTAAHLNGCWAQVKPHTHAWNLDSMLIKPVQRITKYPLLFEDLLACTTPVHPDYFNIRAAAELSRKIALEIDEAKRRKDVVANAISTNKKPKTPKTSLPSPVKDKKGLDFKMFRKEKLPAGMSPSASSVNLAMDAPPEITRTGSALLKDLVGRVDEGDQVVRRVGKEIILWTAGSKEMIVAEDSLMSTWAGVVMLDADKGAGAGADDRIAALQAILEGIVRGPWAILNDEIRDQVMPIFSKLLDTVVNPRKVIAKHQAKASDYTRYIQLVKAKRTPERAILLSALDFYALHSQLLDELPAFLEGYMRILDLGLTAFAAAQAKYYDGVRTRLNEFANRWIARPRHSPQLTFALRRASEDVQGAGSPDAKGADGSTELDSFGASADLMTGRGIVKAWYEAWTPYADAMDHFQCTRPAMVSRIASFNARSNSRPSSRPTSRVSSPAPTGASPGLPPARPGLQHSVSFSSRSRNSSGSSQLSAGANSAHSRSRSTSLLGSAPGSGSTTLSLPAPLPSPLKESRFNPFRSGSKTPKSAQSTPRTSRPSSLHIPGDASANPNRYSFGLPRIEQEPGLDGLGKLGVSPTNRLRMSPAERMIALGSLSVQDVAKDPGAFRAVSDPAQYAPEEAEEDSPSLGREGRPGAQNTGPARAGVLTALVERPERPERPPRPESRTGRSSSTDSGVPFPSSPPRRRSSAATAVAGLGLGDVEAHPVDSIRRTSGRSVVSTQSTVTSAHASPSDETRRERTDRRPVRAHAPPPPSAFPASAAASVIASSVPATSRSPGGGAGSGYIAAHEGVPPSSPSREKSRYTPGSGNEIDAAEGWRSEPVLYRCACVADFHPTEIGDRRYRGLRFLSMVPGDLFEVFHEVGRIDELPKFPYPEVGVDNDGVLVGRAEDGAIGLLICSFLQPLQE